MTTEQFIEKLNRRIEQIEKEDKPLQIAVRTVMAAQVNRIFSEGKNSTGNKIGSYNSVKPLYVSDINAPKKVNKTGKNGKRIKSGYYTSYKAFRASQGRESNFVNIRLTNELQSDFANANVSVSQDKVASPASAIRVNQHLYKVSLKKDINIKKKLGLEKKYGRIFSLTKQEKELFINTARFEFRKAMQL